MNIIIIMRLGLIITVLGIVLVFLNREQFKRISPLHHNLPTPSFRIGPQLQSTSLSVMELFNRKRINNYIWTSQNHDKIEITLVDLGYTSVFLCTFFNEQMGSIAIQEKVGFNLPQDQYTPINLIIHKANFYLNLTQQVLNQTTISTFQLSLKRDSLTLSYNLTHILHHQHCANIYRGAAFTYKCYGGEGYGAINILHIISNRNNNKNVKKELTYSGIVQQRLTCTAFDALRGSAWHWEWVWGSGSGFSQVKSKEKTKQYIGINIGSLFNQGEDFLFLNGLIYPFSGLTYNFSDHETQETQITFQSQFPQMTAIFTIKERTHFMEDMGVIKNDMIKYEGYWKGVVVNPISKEQVYFEDIAGLLETAKSCF